MLWVVLDAPTPRSRQIVHPASDLGQLSFSLGRFSGKPLVLFSPPKHVWEHPAPPSPSQTLPQRPPGHSITTPGAPL